MNVRLTSLEAYDALRDTGTLQRREQEVMDAVYYCFYDSRFNRKELARALGWEINRVTGRVLSLIKKQLLEELPDRRNGGYLLRIRPKQEELSL